MSPNPGSRYRHFWGYVFKDTQDGWTGRYGEGHEIGSFVTQADAIDAVITGALNSARAEDSAAEYDRQ